MSRPKARPQLPQPLKPVPLTRILERGFVATLAGFVAARPLIAGDDRMGAVGPYETPQPFLGTILGVRLDAGDDGPRGR